VSRDVDRDPGFALVEVLVSLLLIVAAAAGLAPLYAMTAAAARQGRVAMATSLLAREKVEELRALTWAYAPDGAAMTDLETDISVRPWSAFGRGLSASPSDSLERNADGYVDYLDGNTRWVGSGPLAPSEAVYIRRWRITPMPGAPGESCIFEVFVTTTIAEARGSAGSSAGVTRRSGDALLVTVTTRKQV
jgi:type II secretory pathway pseudopilin PulG